MNALVPTPQYHAQLPAFLRDPALFASSDAAIAGISSGAPPAITVRASKWHLKFGNEEQHVNQAHLDVIVLDGNAFVSKTYYENPYNPNEEAPPPTCWSDNGIAPSTEAGTPQAASCAVCPHAAWGSKITQTGSRTKACGDSKKLAVVLAVDTPILVNGAAGVAKAYEQVFLLRVPTMSMQNWKIAGKQFLDNGIPVQGVIMRLTFDPETDYPAILFKAAAFVKEEAVFHALMARKESSATKTAIGANDQPRQAAPALAAPPAFMQSEAVASAVAPAAPQPIVVPPVAVPAPVAVAPAPLAAEPRRRGRPVTPPDALAPQAVPAPVAAAPAAPSPVIVAPQPASSELDLLLAKAMA